MTRMLSVSGLILALAASPAAALVGTSTSMTPSTSPSTTAGPGAGVVRDAGRVPGQMVLLLPAGEAQAGARLALPQAASPSLLRLDAALAARGLVRERWLAGDGRAVLVSSVDPAFDATADQRARELVAAGVARAAAPNCRLELQLTTPNDPYLTTQWHLGTTAAGIRAQNAWDLEVGSPAVVIGFPDTGVDTGHPDLISRIWVNGDEIPANLIDDDGNGYIDDVNGWDFATHDNDPNPVFSFDSTAGMDVGWHGTFAAALAAAAGNNATGITGVAWDCRIMPLRVTDEQGNTTLAAVSEAWNYALDNGCSVLNLSLAGTDPVLEPFFQTLVNDAVNADVVCVAAAGNSGLDNTHWPAACDSTLSVAATTNTNQRASFSCWGWFVNIAAPGQDMWSALARNYTRDAAHDFYFSFFFGWDGTNPYMYNSGTSFAAPIVAGAVALVRSQYPGVPPKYIIDHMIATADAVNYDNPIGGRLNAYNALLTYVDAGSGSDGANGLAARLGPALPNPLRAADGGTTVAFTLPNRGEVRLAVYDVNGRRVRDLVAGGHDAGTHRARWDGTDAAGRRVAPGLYFVAGALGGAARSARVTVLP